MRRALVAFLSLAAPLGCSLIVSDDYSSGFRGAPDEGGAPGVDGGSAVDAQGAGTEGDAEAGPSEDPYVAAVLADSPASYWRLEEASGESFADELARRPLAVMHPEHATVGQPGARGRGVVLDGNTELRVGGTFDFGYERKFTIEAWLRSTSTDDKYHRIFSKIIATAAGPTDGTYAWLNAGRRRVGFERWRESTLADGVYWDTVLPQASFTHFVVVFDGVLTRMYADGRVVGTATKAPAPTANPDAPVTWGYDFAGGLDELAFYETPLSAERVKAHYDAAQAKAP